MNMNNRIGMTVKDLIAELQKHDPDAYIGFEATMYQDDEDGYLEPHVCKWIIEQVWKSGDSVLIGPHDY